MKNFIYIFYVIFIFSCNSNINKNEIVGNWKVVKFDQTEVDAQIKVPEEGNDIVKSTVYTFNRDSSVIINSTFHDNIKGEYHINNDTLTLTYFAYDRKTSEEYFIEEIASNKVILTQSFDGMGTLSFMLKRY